MRSRSAGLDWRTLRALWPFLFVLASCGNAASNTTETPADDAGSDVAAEVAVDAAVAPYSPVSIHVLPDEGATTLLNAIAAAKTSIHVEVYLLGDDSVIAALIAAKKRGVDVKVILEKDPYGAPSANDATYSQLNAAGVSCAWANARYSLTHAKFALFDGTRAIIATYNFVKSAFTGNREYGAVDDDPTDVAEAEAIFAADLTGADGPASGRLVLAPRDARDKLRAFFTDTSKTLDVEMEEINDTEMTQRIAAAAKRGAKVRVIVPKTTTTAMTTSLDTLAAAGVSVRVLSTPSVHAKMALSDGKLAYVGSVNLSLSSLDKNRELGVLTDTVAAISKMQATFDADFAKATPR